jgi:NodT family efflux transporter outer membrane factor (OMF) lipoprotein
MNKVRNLTACSALSALLLGCAVGPDYREPEIDTGSGWIEPPPVAGDETGVDRWWRRFDDPVLDALVEQDLARNLEIRQAAARIAEARALRSTVSGRNSPSIDASASITRRRQSENGPLPIAQFPGIERDQTIYEPGFDALWEFDLFGGTRRAVEAADARVDASIETAQSVYQTMAAELVRSYVELRGAQHELELRRAAIDAATSAVALLRQRVAAGDLPDAELAAAETSLATARAELPLADARARAAALAIARLTGDLPEAHLDLLDRHTDYVPLAAFPIGERAELLRRRPDVRAAERNLAAATADIGSTTAQLFPRFTIAASGGFQSLDTGSLTDSESQTFALMPLISWRIFDGGRIRAQIHAAEARQQQAALGYEQAVLGALGDAERALLRYDAGLDALSLQRAALDAARQRYAFAETRQRAGDISRLELLDAEAALRSAELAYARVHTQTATDLVALCKALGGGWGDNVAGA